MKLCAQSSGILLTLGYYCLAGLTAHAADTQSSSSQTQPSSLHSRLIDRCCQVGRERATESPKFTCKLSAREALILKQPTRNLLVLSAESILSRDPTFADQCEMVLESCCMAHHRTRNCDTGKQFAKSGATCMDVELSKEASVATESFNDCCMACSLGVLAARNPAQNETLTGGSRAARCKLISPLASSLSGQLYEQTYIECCQENLPRFSSALIEPGAPVDCANSNPCAHRCLSAGSSEPNSARELVQQDRCDCFAGYRLAADQVNCLDIDECKTGKHTCNRQSEVCDNTRGSFRCLARERDVEEVTESFSSLRLCAPGSRWLASENRCQPSGSGESNQRSASLQAVPSHHRSLSLDTWQSQR